VARGQLISAPQSLAQPPFLDNLYRRGRCLAAALFASEQSDNDRWGTRKVPTVPGRQEISGWSRPSAGTPGCLAKERENHGLPTVYRGIVLEVRKNMKIKALLIVPGNKRGPEGSRKEG
jgi:hypothetical protein